MLVPVMLLLASCAARASPGPAAAPRVHAGQLQITQVRVGNAVPIEGALSYIRIESGTGVTLTQRQLSDGHTLRLAVPPGTHRLVSWQRICDANCGNLDPPSIQCVRPFTLRDGEHLAAMIRVNFASGCAIVLHR